jgi:hypothetical protein
MAESELHERVGRLEVQMDWIKEGLGEIKQVIHDMRIETRQEI